MLTSFDPNQIEDKNARQAIIELLNLFEELKGGNAVLREEVQQLRDENNRLKGEQGQPNVQPNKGKKDRNQDYSSEKERRQSKQWRKGSKVDKIEIDREEKLAVDKQALPSDAQFKGYELAVCRREPEKDLITAKMV